MNTVKAYFATVLLGGAVGVFSSLVGDRLTEVSFDTIAREAEIIVVLPVYDDSHTRSLVDYLDRYDDFSWVDRFGIHRTALPWQK